MLCLRRRLIPDPAGDCGQGRLVDDAPQSASGIELRGPIIRSECIVPLTGGPTTTGPTTPDGSRRALIRTFVECSQHGSWCHGFVTFLANLRNKRDLSGRSHCRANKTGATAPQCASHILTAVQSSVANSSRQRDRQAVPILKSARERIGTAALGPGVPRPKLTFADHVHELNASKGHGARPEGLEPHHRSHLTPSLIARWSCSTTLLGILTCGAQSLRPARGCSSPIAAVVALLLSMVIFAGTPFWPIALRKKRSQLPCDPASCSPAGNRLCSLPCRRPDR